MEKIATFAPRTCIVTGSHKINLITENKIAGEGYNLPIHIGNGCWICIGATILGGSDIGDCSIVAAGSIVKGTFPKRQLILWYLSKRSRHQTTLIHIRTDDRTYY